MQKFSESRPYRHTRPGPWLHPAAPEVGKRRAAQASRAAGDAQLGRAMAWFSIGVGLAYLLAPRVMARRTGMPDWPLLMRATGARELAVGVGLLSRSTSPVWRYARVAGDAMDLAMLGLSLTRPGRSKRRLATAAAVMACVTAFDVRASLRRGDRGDTADDTPQYAAESGNVLRAAKSVIVKQQADECYRLWRDLEHLPRFMKDLDSVRVMDERHSHWTVRGPRGAAMEWDAEITEDQPGHLLAWRSFDADNAEHTGAVRFSAGPGGTRVQLETQYRPLPGKAAAVDKAGADAAERLMEENLQRFKLLAETGQVPPGEDDAASRRSLRERLFPWIDKS